jgi:type II secretory pathway pseudopilin PulG
MNYKNKPILNSFPLLKRKEATKSWFTLVELIVVITILAILWTIAFISMSWYSKSSRDSVRISDVSNMKTSLELFHLNAGKYPLPDNAEIVTYSWETLWSQWTFWSTVVSNVSRNLNEIPTDPLSDKEYIYSTSWNRNEFQILNLLEWDLAINTISQTNAASTIRIPRLDWVFNGVFIKTANHIVPVPSLVTSLDLTLPLDLKDNVNSIKSQVITWWSNIPKVWNINSATWALTWLVLSVYSWPAITSKSSNTDKANVMLAIQWAYTWSTLANSDIYKLILSKTTTEDLAALLDTVVLSGNIESTSTSNDDSPPPPAETTCIDVTTWLAWLWHLDWDANDSSLNSNNWTINWTSVNELWKVWSGALFNWTSNDIIVTNNSALEPVNVTFMAWIKPTWVHVGSQRVMEKYWWASPSYVSYGFRWSNGDVWKLVFDIWHSTWYSSVESTTNTFNDVWSLVVWTYDGANIKIYVNWVLESSAPLTAPITYSIGGLFMGRYGGGGYYYNWSLDDVAVYNRALTSTEIQDIYNWWLVWKAICNP